MSTLGGLAVAPKNGADTDPDLSNNSAELGFEVECVLPIAIDTHPFNKPGKIKMPQGPRCAGPYDEDTLRA